MIVVLRKNRLNFLPHAAINKELSEVEIELSIVVTSTSAQAQRRYEEREYKKSMRRSGPRVKQLKVKTG